MITQHPKSPGAVKIDPDAALALDTACPVLITISKNLTGRILTSPDRNHACPCPCDYPGLSGPIQTYSLGYRADWKFSSNQACDQVKEANLLDGCYMVVKGSLKLRDAKCPPHDHPGGRPHQDLDLLIGCQEGEFILYRPVDPNDPTQGFVAVFLGELYGTVGLDNRPGNAHPRCCQENLTRGTIKGRGVGPMQDCELCAIYEGDFNSLDDVDLCRQLDFRWNIWLDGTICCPCPETKDEGGKKY